MNLTLYMYLQSFANSSIKLDFNTNSPLTQLITFFGSKFVQIYLIRAQLSHGLILVLINYFVKTTNDQVKSESSGLFHGSWFSCFLGPRTVWYVPGLAQSSVHIVTLCRIPILHCQMSGAWCFYSFGLFRLDMSPKLAVADPRVAAFC